jgi:hypothetical protein
MNDHYKVLAQFNDTVRPDGPFQIGMHGNIKGVEWTIIGWIHYKTGEFPSEEWDEFFLYSPTHGYAWLIYEGKTLSFSRKVRDVDLYHWKEKQPKSLFYQKGHYLQKESSYVTYIQYVEGELNWVAKFGDTFRTWDYDGVRYQSLSVEEGKKELEVYYTQRLDKADIYSAFGLEYVQESKRTKKTGKSKITYEGEIKDKTPYDGWKILFMLLAITILFSFFNAKTISTFYVNDNDASHLFTVDSNAFLTEISISTPSTLGNSKMTLDKNKTKIFYIDANTVYYMKKYLSHNWTSTSTETKIYLKLVKGTYTLKFQKSSDYQTNISITINEKYIRLKYILPLFIAVCLILFYYYRSYFNFGWKLLLVPLVLIFVIVGYIFFDEDFLFGIVLFSYYIYDNFYGEEDEYD